MEDIKFNMVDFLQEESENRLAVQEALSLLSEAFGHVDDSGQRQVEALIMQNIDKVCCVFSIFKEMIYNKVEE